MNIIQKIAGLFKRSNSIPGPINLPTPSKFSPPIVCNLYLHTTQQEELKSISLTAMGGGGGGRESGLYDEPTKAAIANKKVTAPKAKKSKRVNWSRARSQIAALAIGKCVTIYVPAAAKKKGINAVSSVVTRVCHEVLGKGCYATSRRPNGNFKIIRLV